MEEIRFGKWRAEIAVSCGCNVTALEWDGEPILRRPESEAQLRDRPCLYGMPLLFPANRTDRGEFSSQGRSLRLPINESAWNNHIHGLLKDAPFVLISAHETQITAALENRGQYYPFPFAITITDALSDKGFTRKLVLKNTGPEPMPYTIGFHTAFAEPASFSVPILQRCEMDERYLPTGKLLPLTDQQQTYRTGCCPIGKVSGVYVSGGNQVRIGHYAMTVSAQFDHWVLFNGNGDEGYLCVEPQCGGVNGLNNGKHRVLEPGAEEVFIIEIKENQEG